MTGTVKLIFKEETVRQHKFSSTLHKERIVMDWKKLYGPMFERCKVLVDPDKKKFENIYK